MVQENEGGPAFMSLPPFDPKTGRLNVIVETPKGSRNKYIFDLRRRMFRLKKTLPLGSVFPFDFGFVPRTLGEDGDPLDVLVLMEESAFPGCWIMADLLGVIELEQRRKGEKPLRNDRFIAHFGPPDSLEDLKRRGGRREMLLRQIEHFFVCYGSMEGKILKPLRRSGPQRAAQLIRRGGKAFRQTMQHSKTL